jgi:hypothetical protein
MGHLRFCKLAHQNAYEHRQRSRVEAEVKRKGWRAFLSGGSSNM